MSEIKSLFTSGGQDTRDDDGVLEAESFRQGDLNDFEQCIDREVPSNSVPSEVPVLLLLKKNKRKHEVKKVFAHSFCPLDLLQLGPDGQGRFPEWFYGLPCSTKFLFIASLCLWFAAFVLFIVAIARDVFLEV